MILPIVHLNGTSKEELLRQITEAGVAIDAALRAFSGMAPNPRDYYPDPGRFERALQQHRDRAQKLFDVYQELLKEAELIADL